MSYYYLVLLLSLILSVWCRNSNSPQTKTASLLIPLGCTFVFFAFRVGFTPDYYNYEMNYLASNFSRYEESGEVGYVFLVSLIPTYRLLLVVQTFLLCTCFYVALKNKIDENYWWVAFFMLFSYSGFLIGNMSGLRSSFITVAFSLGLLIKDKSKLGFVAAVVLLLAASTIHKSGLIMIPFLFIGNKPWSKNAETVVLVFAISFCIISIFFANTINTVVNNAVDFMGFEDRFESYRKDEIENVMKVGYFTILRLAMLFFLLFETIGIVKEDITDNLFVKFTAVFFLLNFMPGVGLVSRFYYYFSIPVLIGASIVISKESNIIKRVIYIVCLLLYGIWDMYLLRSTYFFMDTFGHYDNVLF